MCARRRAGGRRAALPLAAPAGRRRRSRRSAIAAALVVGEAWDDIDSLRDRPALFGAAIVLGAVRPRGARRADPADARSPCRSCWSAALPVPGPDRGRDRGRQPAAAPLPGDRRRGDRRRAWRPARRRASATAPSRGRSLWALAAAVVLYAAQSAYSEDIGFATRNVSFFLVPFAAMFVLLARHRLDAARCSA